jgi:RHS repeat-associated protein
MAIKYRVQAGGRTVAEIVRTKPVAVWVDAVRYMHDDFLGSTQLVSSKNAMGVPISVNPIAHDAWGCARNPVNWNLFATAAQAGAVSIGFTGHRAELDHGLIDMGGRMYDPVLSRFTSPDPLVSDPYAGQPYNRYSYVGNRPLRFVDPSGWAEEPGTPEGEEFGDKSSAKDEFYEWADGFGRGAMRLGADTLNGIDEYIDYVGQWDAELSTESVQGIMRATWNSPLGAPVRKLAEHAQEKIEEAVQTAAYILAHPEEIPGNLRDEVIANITTVLYASDTISKAINRGDYGGAVDAYVDAAKAVRRLLRQPLRVPRAQKQQRRVHACTLALNASADGRRARALMESRVASIVTRSSPTPRASRTHTKPITRIRIHVGDRQRTQI